MIYAFARAFTQAQKAKKPKVQVNKREFSFFVYKKIDDPIIFIFNAKIGSLHARWRHRNQP